MYYTVCRETGTRIDGFTTLNEAMEAVSRYEESDRLLDSYVEDFYQVYDEEKDEYLD